MLILDAVSPLERIQLSGALAVAVKALSGVVSALERVKLAREVATILGKLGANIDAPKAPELIFDLSRPEETTRSLGAYLDSGLSALPEALRASEARTIAELAQQVGAKDVMYQARAAAGEFANSFSGAFAEISGRGLPVDIDTASLGAKLEEAAEISKQLATSDPQWVATQARLRTLNTDIAEKTKSLDAQIRVARDAYRSASANGDVDVAQSASDLEVSIYKQRQEAVAEYSKAFEQGRRDADARAKAFKQERQERANDAVRAEGEAVIAAIKSASPVTEEQAMTWALAQKVEDSAFKRLAKNGYPKAQVLKDLADFYQISGGKASAISLVNTGSKRAYASNIDTSTNEKIIAIDTDFNRTVLFHELAHHLENDAIAKAAANGYLMKRRESEKPYTLRSLTGSKGYGASEVAYKDSFLNPYIGKVYRDNTTEVFSMAVQYLANPLDAARMYAKDPELFAMVSGYLGSELTPAMKARLSLHSGKIEEKADLEQQAAGVIADVASTVMLTTSTWFEDFRARQEWEAKYSVGRAGGEAEKMITVGAYSPLGLYVIQGPVRTSRGGRRSKGFMVLRETGGYPDAVFAGRSLDEAKALVAAAIRTNGDLYEAKSRYFGNGATSDAIEALKQLSGQGA